MIVIVDASVAAKWFFIEEYSAAALDLLDNPFELHAPDFLYLELNSLLVKRVRRRELVIREAFDIEDEIESLPIQSYPTSALRKRAFEMALRTKSSVYDCLYLALAEALESRMVTADRKFFMALQDGPLQSDVLWIEDLAKIRG